MPQTRAWLTTAVLLCVAALWLGSAMAAPRDLGTGWEYRWGDSPVSADGVPTWVKPGDDDAWNAIDFPANPPGRRGQTHAWFRLSLPEGDWQDPALYITSINLIADVYLDGERLYQHGTFDDDGNGRFAGWPWHMIRLPEDFGGRQLTLRVYSDYTAIGLWGEIMLIERADLFPKLLRDALGALIVGPLCLLLALFAVGFALFQDDRRRFMPISLFALASGIMIIAESPVDQLLIDRPLLWDNLAAAGYFTLPIALGRLLEHWFADTRSRRIRRIWQFHLVYLVGALGASGLGWINLSITFPVFDVLLVLSISLLLAIIAPHLGRFDTRQRAILAAFALFGALLLVDMAVAHGLLPWQRVPTSAGALAFALVIGGISLIDYAHTQRELRRLNHQLEQEVEERTHQLQQLVERLEIDSTTDPLTGLHNRRHFDECLRQESRRARSRQTPLAMAMLDIDHFKRINDGHGHAAGDRVLAGIAMALREHFRDDDEICRIGGEEFVVLLPGTGADTARERAASLMASLADRVYWHDGRMLGPVTLSCGIAAYPAHTADPMTLPDLADRALYGAKETGRNRIITAS
ncbi:GGDEF domain-containing protein [Halomonas sp. SL1]|uniref:GGDEF domain-containing protein n=1 Tax=Halomonas sp. SL1 TaxID=2137478 RepID=UPI000D161D28|nr:GGDEF domain-containing protein [Halomonas sp. SL1]RAH38284.1 GGDEF domain-containing protein [Halomonas sp. SL1]